MSRQDPYEGDDASAWSAFAGAGPRWRDDDSGGPGDVPRPPGGGRRRRPSQQADPLVFDDYQDPSAGRSVFEDHAPSRGRRPDMYDDYGAPGYDEWAGVGYDTAYDDAYGDIYGDIYGDDVYVQHEPPPTERPPGPARARPKVSGRSPGGGPSGGDRDMRLAVGVGAALIAAALVAFQIDPLAVVLLVTALLCVASLEYFTATQRAGFDPLMPVGVTATVAMPLAAYEYGQGALPLVLVLSVTVCLVWYLVGAGGERPMANVGATLLGICWVGLFGAFAGLLLAAPNGESLLVAAIVPTIGYDVGALFVGRSAGSRPLSAASPNKTKEGLAGGMVMAVVAALLLGMLGPYPLDLADGLKIGLVAAAMVPLGDLSESLLKRDLGVKDMGSVLPGHGGVLDRFDGLLFALPAIWYLALVSDGFLG